MPLALGVAIGPTFHRSAAGGLGAGILVQWSDQSTNEDGFRIYYGTDGVTFPNTVETGPNAESKSIGNLIDGQLYYFYVVAFNSAGESDPTPVEAAYAGTQPPPQTWLIKEEFDVPVTGYEDGPWSTDATSVVDPVFTPALKGAQSLRCANASGYAYIYRNFPGGAVDEVWMHARVKITQIPGNHFPSVMVGNITHSFGVCFITGAPGQATVKLYTVGGAGASSLFTVALNAVAYVWVHYVRNGTCEIFVTVNDSDRNDPVDDEDNGAYLTFTAPDEAVDQVLVGIRDGAAIFDNVLVSEDEIGDNPNP